MLSFLEFKAQYKNNPVNAIYFARILGTQFGIVLMWVKLIKKGY